MAPSLRWRQAVRHILDRRDSESHEEETVDRLGEAMANILNNNPQFNSSRRSRNPDDNEKDSDDDDECRGGDDRSFDPIFSSRRLTRWRKGLQNFPAPKEALVSALRGGWETAYFVVRYREAWWKLPIIMVVSTVFVAVGIAVLLCLAVNWTIRFCQRLGWWMVSVLVDVEEVYAALPKPVVHQMDRLGAYLRRIDRRVLGASRVAGREWSKEGFHFDDGMDAESRNKTLWQCPPPPPKKEQQDDNDDNELSPQSVQHVAALHFCHRMLRDEYLRKKAVQKKRRALQKAASMHNLVKESPSDTTNGTKNGYINGEHSLPNIGVALVGDEDEAFVEEPPTIMKSNSGLHDRRMLHVRTRSKSEDIEVVGVSPRIPRRPPLLSPESRRTSLDSDRFFESINEEGDIDEEMSISTIDDILSSEASSPRRRHRRISSEGSILSDKVSDMNWADVGAQIGMRLLSSEHVQKAMTSQDTAERIIDISKKVEENFGASRRNLAPPKWNDSTTAFNSSGVVGDDTFQLRKRESNVSLEYPLDVAPRSIVPPVPVHSMWTSASAVARRGSLDDDSDPDQHMLSKSSVKSRAMSPTVYALLDKGVASPPMLDNGDDHDFYNSEKSLTPKSDTELLRAADAWTPNTRAAFHTSLMLSSREISVTITNSTLDDGQRGVSRDPSMPMLKDPPSPVAPEGQPLFSVSPRRADTFSGYSGYGTPPRTTPKRSLLQTGVKMAVPLFPSQPFMKAPRGKVSDSFFQMATVQSSKRIYVRPSDVAFDGNRRTNCLQVTVCLDKSFLRDGRFAEMTLRVMDSWADRYMPRHSKFPIGSCVATTFGIGILVGWRVEHDVHVVRSLWQRRGAGSAHAYLNRDALHCVVEAAVGFTVETTLGKGVVLSYVHAGRQFKSGRYFVLIKAPGRHKGHVLEFNRCDILSCHGAEFIPVLEFIREAAQYRIRLDNYRAALRQQMLDDKGIDEKKWRSWSKGFQTVWAAFLKAVDEDSEFDEDVNEFFSNVIDFLEQLDKPSSPPKPSVRMLTEEADPNEGTEVDLNESLELTKSSIENSGSIWIMDEVLGGIFGAGSQGESDVEVALTERAVANDLSYRRAFAVIRTLMRTASIARVESVDQPDLKLGMAICYEFLLFVRTVLKVQQRNVSPTSLAVWRRAWEEIVGTFGPVKGRLEKIARGIAERMERQGNRAKAKILRFVDIVLVDERLLQGLEHGEWEVCLDRLEVDLVKARIIDEKNRQYYHKTVAFICKQLAPKTRKNESAAARNDETLGQIAKVLKWLAAPRRSILSFIQSDHVLDLLERICIRVFRNQPGAAKMLTIHASGIHTLRQLRMFKDFTIAGKLWIPMLDAADEELAWAVTKIPAAQGSKDIMTPLSKLFSLCVGQFHKIDDGNLMSDWMDFLMEDEAVRLIHEVDVKLILAVEALSKDVKEVMNTLPYYRSIDDDILKLMDEVDIAEFLKEAAEAIDDSEKIADFIYEKSKVAIERFLNYLPKMSIPVQQRELSDGWALTCRGEDGGDLTLSDVSMRRENLKFQVMGGETMHFPLFDDDDPRNTSDTEEDSQSTNSFTKETDTKIEEVSILDTIYEMIVRAEHYGCWQLGVGGVEHAAADSRAAGALKGIPISKVLTTGIDLWRNLEIDDDELLEIAIKDVSYQIRLQQEREEGVETVLRQVPSPSTDSDVDTCETQLVSDRRPPRPPQRHSKRFNPRVDPTVLLLEMKKLTLKLDKFQFRIEKLNRTIFDPTFEGWGSLCVRNVCIRLRVECRKERTVKLGQDINVPVLQCQELRVALEKVQFEVNETGADWILNKAVDHFSASITEAVESNLKEQVKEQVKFALENLNSYFVVNPDLMLSILGITMDDLEENMVWV